jgi:hypothetical protein
VDLIPASALCTHPTSPLVPPTAAPVAPDSEVELVTDSPPSSGPEVVPEDLACVLVSLAQFKVKPTAVPPFLARMSLFEVVSRRVWLAHL